MALKADTVLGTAATAASQNPKDGGVERWKRLIP